MHLVQRLDAHLQACSQQEQLWMCTCESCSRQTPPVYPPCEPAHQQTNSTGTLPLPQAQADAVMAHATVQSLQSALRKVRGLPAVERRFWLLGRAGR